MGTSLIANATSALGSILFAQDDDTILGINTTLFFVIGAVLVLGLGGLLFYLRNKQSDE